jgi:hypothetical protein
VLHSVRSSTPRVQRTPANLLSSHPPTPLMPPVVPASSTPPRKTADLPPRQHLAQLQLSTPEPSPTAMNALRSTLPLPPSSQLSPMAPLSLRLLASSLRALEVAFRALTFQRTPRTLQDSSTSAGMKFTHLPQTGMLFTRHPGLAPPLLLAQLSRSRLPRWYRARQLPLSS